MVFADVTEVVRAYDSEGRAARRGHRAHPRSEFGRAEKRSKGWSAHRTTVGRALLSEILPWACPLN